MLEAGDTMRIRMKRAIILGAAILLAGGAAARAQTTSAGGVPTTTVLPFPHLAHGAESDGFWQTNYTFVNNSTRQATGNLQLFRDDGTPLTLGTTRGTGNRFQIIIPAGAKFEIETDGIGPLVTGWALAGFTGGAVVGSSVFAKTTTNRGRVVSVGVLSRTPKDTFVVPVEARTGLAITNSFRSVSNQTAVVNNLELTAFNASGTQLDVETLNLNAGEHRANIISGWFPGKLPPNFVGSVRVVSKNSFFTALAISFANNPTLGIDPGFAVTAIAYDTLAQTYSGNFQFIGGPNLGSTGILTLRNIEHFDSAMFSGSSELRYLSNGRLVSGRFLGSVDDFGLTYSISSQLLGASLQNKRAVLLAAVQGDGSLAVTIVDDGEGNSGTATLTAQATGGVQPPTSRALRENFVWWVDP